MRNGVGVGFNCGVQTEKFKEREEYRLKKVNQVWCLPNINQWCNFPYAFGFFFFGQDVSCKDTASQKYLLKHSTKKSVYLAWSSQVVDVSSCLYFKYPPCSKPRLSSSSGKIRIIRWQVIFINVQYVKSYLEICSLELNCMQMFRHNLSSNIRYMRGWKRCSIVPGIQRCHGSLLLLWIWKKILHF